jgi:hypothetical protein
MPINAVGSTLYTQFIPVKPTPDSGIGPGTVTPPTEVVHSTPVNPQTSGYVSAHGEGAPNPPIRVNVKLPIGNTSLTGTYNLPTINGLDIQGKGWMQNIMRTVVTAINQGSDYLGNLTPVQKLWNAAGGSRFVSSASKFAKPGYLASNTIENVLHHFGQDKGNRVMDFQNMVIGKSASDFTKVVKDIAVDATIGGAYQGLKSLTGAQVRLSDVLPGATALSQILPGAKQTYDYVDKTKAGKLAADAYLIALNSAQAGVAGRALFNTFKPITATEKALAGLPDTVSRPLAYGGKIVNAGNIGKAAAVLTGSTAVHLTKEGIKATREAAQKGADATNAQTAEYQREFGINQKNAGGSNGDTTQQPDVYNYYTTNNTTTPDTTPSAGTDSGDGQGDTTPNWTPQDVQNFINNNNSAWQTAMAGIIGAVAGRSSGGGSSSPTVPRGLDQYGGGSGAPLQRGVKAKVAHKRKKIKPGHDHHANRNQREIVNRAVQTG